MQTDSKKFDGKRSDDSTRLPSDTENEGHDGESIPVSECRECIALRARIDELTPFVTCETEIAKLRRLKTMVDEYINHRGTSFMALVKYMKEAFE